ncbi:MAG: glycosyltransferase, partial [Bacteroidales bacterium]|nr:glycosyltransferase [Bacteroidales bacterium]
NRKIKILSLSRNFGHQAAFTAGLEHARGDVIAMMDGDLQDPPELLAEMYRKIKDENFDVVSGKRTGRKGKKGKNLITSFFHFIFRNIGDIRNMENYGNFSMMTREALNALLSMKEKVRYLPGLRTFIGFRQGSVEYVRDIRYSGKPKMSFRNLLFLAADAIFSFSKFPIRFCLILGIFGALFFLAAGIIMLILHFSGSDTGSWSPALLSVWFLGSVQLIFLGILGEYIYRSYKETQNRPLYFIRKCFDDGPENDESRKE